MPSNPENQRSSCILLRNVLLLISLISLAVLTLSPNGATRIYAWPWNFYTQILLLLPLLTLSIQCFCIRKPFHIRDPLAVGILSSLLFWVLISATLSPFPEQSFEASTTYVYAIGGLYLTICLLGSFHGEGYGRRIQRLHYVLAGFFVLFLFVSLEGWLIALLQHIQNTQALNQAAGENIFPYHFFDIRNERPLGHSNYTAGMAILMLPWLAILTWTRSGFERIGWIIASSLSLLLLFSSGSRGGLIGLAILIVGSISYLALRHKIKRRNLLIIIGLSSLVVIGIGVSNKRIRDLTIHFAKHRTLNEGDAQRMNMLKAGWEMGTDRIITGYGPGTTPRVYPRYRAKLSGGVETALQLHNTPVQIWADLGYFGTAFFILFLGILAIRFQKALPFFKDKLSKDSQGTLLAAGLSLLGYSAFSLTDYQLDIPIFACLLALTCAVILSLTNFQKVRKRKTPQSYIMGVTAFVLVGFILIQVFPSLRARSIFSSAVDHLEQDDFSSFQIRTKKAIAMAPHEPYYLNSTAGAFLLESHQTQDLKKRHDLTTKAIDYLVRSLQIDPNQEICHFNLGWLYLDRNPTLAGEHFVQAAFLVPDKGGVYLGYGLGLLHQNKNKEAHRALALEAINDPRFITSPIWDTPLLNPHRKRTLESASEIISSWKYKSEVSFQTRKKLAYTNALLLWWTGQDYQIEALITNGDRSSKSLFQLLKTPESFHSDAIPSQPWKNLYLAWKESSKQSQALHQSLLSRHGLTLSSERENTYKEIIGKYRNSPFSDLIKAPAGNQPPLMKTYQRRRIAYGMLMKNMDGPTPVDAYVVQENGIVNDFFGSIFPLKGSLPNTLFTNELSSLSAPQDKR